MTLLKRGCLLMSAQFNHLASYMAVLLSCWRKHWAVLLPTTALKKKKRRLYVWKLMQTTFVRLLLVGYMALHGRFTEAVLRKYGKYTSNQKRGSWCVYLGSPWR